MHRYPDKTSNAQRDALVAAAGMGAIALMHHLLSLGASVTESSPFFGSPLHEAVVGGHEEVFESLIKCGADVKAMNEPAIESFLTYENFEDPAPMGSQDNRAWTVLEDAAIGGHTAMVRRFLLLHSDWDHETKRRAMRAAIRGGNLEIFEAIFRTVSPDQGQDSFRQCTCLNMNV